MNEFLVDTEVLDPEWRFQSIITMPDETCIEVHVSVPERVEWPGVRETAEFAHLSANSVASLIIRSRDVAR